MTLTDTDAVMFGEKQIGIYYLANTNQPAPFALFLHGAPGSEKNHDLAYHLRDKGWHVLVLHFAGVWGSGGAYNPLNHPAEVRTALDFVLSDKAPRPIEKVVLLGYSLGSRAALLEAAEDERVKAVICLGAICDYSEIMLHDSFYENAAPFLNGTDATTFKQHFTALGNGIQPYEALEKIAPRPVLMIHGTDDEIIPPYHLDGFGNSSHVTKVRIPGANHGFALHRADLIKTITHFLDNNFHI